jgi:hypothetical protein
MDVCGCVRVVVRKSKTEGKMKLVMKCGECSCCKSEMKAWVCWCWREEVEGGEEDEAGDEEWRVLVLQE